MVKISLIILAVGMSVTSCTTHQLPAFSSHKWHVDPYSGHAVGEAGLEFAFGAEWMITDTTLMQTAEQMTRFPKLSTHLANCIRLFPEISVDSILFYNPHRGLLFATYSQVKPLKPTSEIYSYEESGGAYSEEYAQMFGQQYAVFDDTTNWINGPTNSVYTNIHYQLKDKRIVLLYRIPFKDHRIAVFQIWNTIPKKGRWWECYPRGTFSNIDFGNPDNIEMVSNLLQWSRNLAVENLKLALPDEE